MAGTGERVEHKEEEMKAPFWFPGLLGGEDKIEMHQKKTHKKWMLRMAVQKCGFWNQMPAELPCVSCGNNSQVVNLSKPQFLPLYNGMTTLTSLECCDTKR